MTSMKYEYEFIGEPSDKLKCLICLEVAKDPKQHEKCGKIFCTQCIERNGNKPCPSCREESPTYFTDTRGAQEIRDLPLRCSNFCEGCSWEGNIGTLNQHLTMCEFEYIPCKYHYIGCNVKKMRKDITKHEEEKDKRHFHLVLQSVAAPTLSDGQSLTFKMENYSTMKKNKSTYDSIPFYTHSNGYKMQLEIYANGYGSGQGTHLSVYSRILEGPFDKLLEWPFLGTISVEILNQNGNFNHYRLDREYVNSEVAMAGGGGWGTPQFISHSTLSEPSGNTQLLKNDSLYFRVSVKVNSQQPWLECGIKMNSAFSNLQKKITQPRIYKLYKFTAKKSNNEAVPTPAFLAGPGSYKMYLIIYPNGILDGEGTHLSWQVFILEGPHDKNLCWPIQGNLRVELLNQMHDENHLVVNSEITEDIGLVVEKSYTCSRFVKHCELQSSTTRQYLKNDMLCFRVTAEFGEYKPWLTCVNAISI